MISRQLSKRLQKAYNFSDEEFLEILRNHITYVNEELERFCRNGIYIKVDTIQSYEAYLATHRLIVMFYQREELERGIGQLREEMIYKHGIRC